MWRMSARSKRELLHVHPDLYDCVQYMRKHSPIDFGVHDGLRTKEEQEEMVRQGASRSRNSRHLIGKDGYGHAVDLVPYINGKLRWDWAPIYKLAGCMWSASVELGVPIRWGGVWDRRLANLGFPLEAEVNSYTARRKAMGRSAFLDGAHFELPNIRAYR